MLAGVKEHVYQLARYLFLYVLFFTLYVLSWVLNYKKNIKPFNPIYFLSTMADILDTKTLIHPMDRLCINNMFNTSMDTAAKWRLKRNNSQQNPSLEPLLLKIAEENFTNAAMDPSEELYLDNEWYHFNDSLNFFDVASSEGSTSFVAHVVIHIFLFVIGVPGNILVLVIFSRSHGDTPFNMSSNAMILSLAAADLGILLVYVPFYVAYEALHLVWPFGVAMCKLVFSFTHICVYTSLGTMIGIAIERYLVTFHLHVYRPKVVMGMIAAWIVALLLSIPQMINLQLVSLDEQVTPDTEYACELVWPEPLYEQILYPIDFVLFYLLPLAVISILYVKITSMLRSAIRQQVPNRRLTKQVKKVVCVLMVVVIVFAICNFPIYILHLYRIFQYEKWLVVAEESPWIFSVCAAIYLVPHSANPIIYAILDRKFRHQIIKVLGKCKPSCLCLTVLWTWELWRFSCREGNEEESTDRRQELLQSLNRCPFPAGEGQRVSQCTKL